MSETENKAATEPPATEPAAIRIRLLDKKETTGDSASGAT
ncbi:hypothetical protein BJY24_000927 [Nocardia transvalensis]|uniref:Uncharacterized protein n=1 Tax=Nocardia transvalensis TaxID=37333 RepID=A0A7W9UGV2_9NOCA|nr:hypothetical protein [Nocardia transvalensis]